MCVLRSANAFNVFHLNRKKQLQWLCRISHVKVALSSQSAAQTSILVQANTEDNASEFLFYKERKISVT